MRSPRGQASLEYVGVVALVAVVLSGGAALTSGGLGPRVAHALRLGLCRVAGEACPRPPADRADLGPCLVRRSSRAQDAAVEVALVELGGGLAVVREEYADGHVELTFSDEGHGGLTAGVGAGFTVAGLEAGGDASLDVSLGWTRGRSWRLAGAREADAFLDRYGHDQTLPGRTVDDVRRLCALCTRLGLGPATPPEPDVRYDEVGGRAAVSAALGVLHGADAELASSAALGWRRERDGSGSLYLDLGREAAAELFVGGTGAAVAGRAAGTLEVEYDRRHRPLALRLRAAGQAGRGTADRAAGPIAAPGRGFRGRSTLVETEVELPLDGGGPALLRRLLRVLRAHRPARAPAELRALLAFVRARARLTARVWSVRDSRAGLGASVALGARAGATIGSSTSAARLEGEWSRLPGLGWLPRADCVGQARSR